MAGTGTDGEILTGLRQEDLQAIADELITAVDEVTLEEVRQVDLSLEADARRGRELLYLIAHGDWRRRTTETADIDTVRTVQSTIMLDIDLNQVTHEALADSPTTWLPLLAVAPHPPGPPPPVGTDGVSGPGVEVFDGRGERVIELSQAEIRRWLASALAGILIDLMAHEQRSGSDGSVVRLSREHHVLLSAAVGHLLRTSPDDGVPPQPVHQRNRLRSEVRDILEQQRRRLVNRARTPDDDGPGDGSDALDDGSSDSSGLPGNGWSVFGSYAVEILAVLRMLALVVVPVPRQQPQQSLTVYLPLRRAELRRTPVGARAVLAGARSRVEVAIAPYAAGGHTTRVIRLRVPAGIDVLSTGSDPRVTAELEVSHLRQLDQLGKLMDRIREAGPGSWVGARLAELAHRRAQAAEDALTNHYLAGDVSRTAQVVGRLRRLRSRLRAMSTAAGPPHHPTAVPHPIDIPDTHWLPTRLSRRYGVTSRPAAVDIHVPAVEEFALRVEPTRTRFTVALGVAETETLATARTINTTNVAMLFTVTGLLAVGNLLDLSSGSRGEVLATLLSIFPTIQAGRIPRLNTSRLIGLLSGTHFRWGLATALPSLLLAGILALTANGWPVVAVSAALTGVQAALGLPFRWLRRVDRQNAPIGWELSCYSPAEDRWFDWLHSAWCRDLTGEALLVGRAPHTYVTVQEDAPGALPALLESCQGSLSRELSVRRLAQAVATTRRRLSHVLANTEQEPTVELGSTNLLGVMHTCYARRSHSLLLFRTEPPLFQAENRTARERTALIPLRTVRGLALLEPPEWVLEIMVGVPEGTDHGPRGQSPLHHLSRVAAASNFSLLTVQLPAPPPRHSADRCSHWLRARVSIPYRSLDSLTALSRFLNGLDRIREETGGDVQVREVPPTATVDTDENVTDGPFDGLGVNAPRPVREPVAERLLHDAELDHPTTPAGTGPSTDTLRLVVHAPVRIGFINRTLRAVSDVLPDAVLLAVESGDVHGQAVLFLAYHAPDLPGKPGEEDSRPAARIEALLRQTDEGAQVLAPQLPGRTPTVSSSTPPGPGSKALLHVSVRTADRPGVLQLLLDELRHQVQLTLRTAESHRLDVRRSHSQTVEGRFFVARIMIRLPLPRDPLPLWVDDDSWSSAERTITRVLDSLPGADGAVPEGTVVRLTLLRTADRLAPGQHARCHQPPGDAIPQPGLSDARGP